MHFYYGTLVVLPILPCQRPKYALAPEACLERNDEGEGTLYSYRCRHRKTSHPVTLPGP